MNYVFLAAGKSSRIFNIIKKPKCLLTLNKQTIIKNLIKKIPKNRNNKIYIVTGFQQTKIKEDLRSFDINYIFNKYYKERDMTYSIYLALKKIKGDIIFSYTDIIYEKKILKLLNIQSNKIVIPGLLNWKGVWKMRKKKISEDAETFKVDDNKMEILEIGKKLKNYKTKYQFMGLFKFPKILRNELISILSTKSKKRKFQTTNLFNLLIKKKMKINFIPTNVKWYEFDDFDDFKYFKKKNDKFYQ